MAFADINGIVLHYEYLMEYADEPVVVFANSLGADFRIWLPLIDELTENWSLLLYDKHGHGLSDVGQAPYTIEDHANDLIGLVDRLDIKKAIFCGLSVGGLIVQAVYKLRPDLVTKIVLCDTAYKIGPAEAYDGRIETVRTSGIASLAEGTLGRWFTPEFHATRKAEVAGYRNMLIRQSVEGYAGTCAAIRDADFTADAPKIKVPVLCVVGDQDGATPPALVKSTADLIPGAQFEIIENAGHIPGVERPEVLAELLADFIND